MVAKEVESSEEKVKTPDEEIHISLNKKVFYFAISFLGLLAILFFVSFFSDFVKDNFREEVLVCGDGSFPETCSLNKPYYCNEEGVLVGDASKCGCPENLDRENGFCSSRYQNGPKEINLRYILEGEEKFISYTVYEDFNDYLYGIPQSLSYSDGEESSRADFKLNKIDEGLQRDFLMPLVVKIQNLAEDKDTQARIAISIVQNIPFGESNRTVRFGGQEVQYSRYPYQVLHDYEGVCGEKTELLAFLLRELGYGTSFFYYQEENHEALGIKCPVEDSFEGTGYCFVETTGPSIITDDEINYADIGELDSNPELYFISEGLVFGEEGFYEKNDADRLQRIRNAVEKRGWIGPLMKKAREKFREKYGLVDEYYSGN